MKVLVSGLTAMFLCTGAAVAADGANKDEAVAMVKKAVGFIKEKGAEKAYPEFTGKAAGFVDRDLYVVVYQLDGKVLAHGSNAKFVGKDLIEAQDVGTGRNGRQAAIVLAGLQVRQSRDQEGRAEADVLREGRQHGGVRRHLQALTHDDRYCQIGTAKGDRRLEGLICSAGSKISGCPGKFSSRRHS
jgi:hypothetical protein